MVTLLSPQWIQKLRVPRFANTSVRVTLFKKELLCTAGTGLDWKYNGGGRGTVPILMKLTIW